jgi:hypothetical protein
MNTKNLTDGLRGLNPAGMTWKFALYNASRSRDGIELDWNLLDMRGIAGWVDTLTAALLDKPVADKPVAEYSPFLSDKENIAALAQTDDLIRDQITDILLEIRDAVPHAPEEFTAGALPKVTGYAFYGERGSGDNAERVLFMKRGNPFLTAAKTRLCIADGDGVAATEKPVLKLTPTVDFVLLGGACYFFSSAIEKDFELESRHLAIAARRLALVSEAGLVNDFERLEEAALTAKNARKFSGFDKEILEYIKRLSIADREEFLQTYGVNIDPDGLMDTTDSEQCELIIDLLCCRSCLDPLGRLSVGSNIVVRE